jgi:hypothetical protein
MINPFDLPPFLYYVVMVIVLLGWGALIFFPRRQWANFWWAGVAVPLTLSLIYIYLLLTFWFLQPPGRFADFFTLAGVDRMFQNSGLLLVAWINILAMDLVVGAWMTRKAAQTGMPYVYLLPCLIMTYVFAGFGFTLFVVVSSFGGRWGYIAKFESPTPTDTDPVVAVPTGVAQQFVR